MMKKISLLLILFFFNQAKAYCPQHVIDIFPTTGSQIAQDQLFVVSLTDFPFIKNLKWSDDGSTNSEDHKKLKFLFVSKDHKIKANILKKLRGDLRHNQFLITPEVLLHVGSEYNLVIKAYTQKTRKVEIFPIDDEASWRVKREPRQAALSYSSLAPKFIRSEFFEMGCGTINMTYFKFQKKEDEIVISEIVDSIDKTKKLAIEVIRKGEVGIGRQMCGGAQLLKRQHEYKIRFKTISTQDHESDFSDFVLFQSP